jgi:hypothetical protein
MSRWRRSWSLTPPPPENDNAEAEEAGQVDPNEEDEWREEMELGAHVPDDVSFAGAAGLDSGEGVDQPGVTVGSGRRDAEYYLARLHSYLYPGAKLTLIEACYALGMEKLKGHVSDTAMDRMCRYKAEVLLPHGNIHPPSLYLLKKCLQVEDAHQYEQHLCINGCCRFPQLRKSQFSAHRGERCPKCKEPRFVVRQLMTGAFVTPRKVFWDFGLAATIQHHFFSNTEFCERRGTGRDKYQFDFYRSKEAAELNKRVGNESLFLPDNSCWELGYDGFQCFAFKQYTAGVLTLRCVDLPPEYRTKKRFAAPLVIIPGPMEPASIEHYVSGVLQEFAAYGPLGKQHYLVLSTMDPCLIGTSPNMLLCHSTGSKKMEVVELKRSADGAMHKRLLVHQPILSGMEADQPASTKFSRFLGVAGFLGGCGGCQLVGTNLTPKGGRAPMHFLGYNKPTKCGLRIPEAPQQDAFCGDDAIRITHAMQVLCNPQHMPLHTLGCLSDTLCMDVTHRCKELGTLS